MKKQSLIIIGAGACGLMAAKELAKYFDITVLEGSKRIGGRINSIKIQNEIIEAGAEFIHGNLPLTFKLLKEAGIKAIPVKGKFYRKENNRFTGQQEMLKGWDKLLRKMKDIKEDISMRQFLELYYPGKDNEAFRKMVTSYTEGFDIADPATASVKSLYSEWSSEDQETYRIRTGYSSLVDHLRQQSEKYGCNILTGKKVKEISWKENNVSVTTDTGEKFNAGKLLITVPVSILQQLTNNGISFSPAIDEYKNAACNIGYGAVIKVVIRFKEICWKKDAAFFLSDETYFPTWWTQLPGKIPLLTGWSGGPKAAMLSRESKEEILSKAINSLSSVLDLEVEQLQLLIEYAEVFNWQEDELAQGAYSFETIYSATAKKVLNTPVKDTIFFAGEALYSGKSPGTVEAALASAKLTARIIRKNS